MNPNSQVNLDKLRAEQLKKNELYKNDPELFQRQIDEKKKKREEAKNAIIKKINDGTLNTKIKSTTKVTLNKTPDIKIIKNDFLPTPEKQIKETRDKLSYTLQMDTVTKDQRSNYRTKKNAAKVIDVEAKLAILNPKINLYYAITSSFLAIVVGLLIYFIY